MPYPPAELPVDLLNETDAETGVDDAAGLEAEGGAPGEGEHAERHNAAAEAINDIVVELGANPSGAEATVQARMEALGLTLAGKASIAELVAEESARVSGLASKAAVVHTHAQYDPFDLLPYIYPMGLSATTTTTITAKRGYFNRFTVAKKREFKFVRWGVGVVGTGAEDKVEVSILKPSGSKMERLGTSGAVKTSFLATGARFTELTTTVVCEPGNVYYVAWSLEVLSGTPQVLAVTNNNGIVGDIGGTGTLANRAFLLRNESFPMPEKPEGFSGSQNPWLVPSEV